ncbi:autophagy-related protein 11-like isoform X1 [Amblyraja radiata]|uniref:autophagy-related protein 11-like isoform X1 n=1 Tax=Amblyraja radiata TaxID=386614 RepID=UPI001403ED14|nr:autophagy-related protein 11-like isoform X1 [Amblyraja radiata]
MKHKQETASVRLDMSSPKEEIRGSRNALTKSETKKLLLKYRKERDEASKRGEFNRDKLNVIRTSMASQIRELKEKVKALNSENKDLHKTIKKLQPELQLDTDSRLTSKLTKEVVKELKERAERCKSLQQENSRLNQEIDKLASELAQAENVRKLLEDRLLAAQSQVRSLSNEHERVLKLWEETKIQRDQTLRVNRLFRESLFSKEYCPQTLDKCVQTIASIPIYRRFQTRKPEAAANLYDIHRETEKIKLKLANQTALTRKERRDNVSVKTSTTIYRISPN